MKKLVTTVAFVLVASLVAAALALGAARATEVHATLDPMADHAKGAPHAKGTFTATVNGTKVSWKLTFSGLTGPANAAHIHKGKAGVSGPVVVSLCGPCRSGQHGTAKVPSALAKQIAKGPAGFYVNVHTAKNQNGEIRGQLQLGM